MRTHPLSDVQSKKIGEETNIWQYVVVLPGAKIGKDCNICSHCFIENDVVIGDRVTIKNGVQIWDGLRIEDDVFVGPNATFINDSFPRAGDKPETFTQTIICKGASVGANATVMAGVTIGRNSMVGAGAVVTRDVPPNAIVVGNPARIKGYVTSQRKVTGTSSKQIVSEGHSLGFRNSNVVGVVSYYLPVVHDLRGNLSTAEVEKQIPFQPKRYFTVFDVPSKEIRGEHAHIECHQFLVCIKGSCSLLVDDGSNREEFLLDSPGIGVYLPPLTWGVQFNYSPEAVLLVLASDEYDSDDYIRDYDEYLKKIGS